MPIFLSHKKMESLISKRSAEACDQIISEMGAEIHDDLIQKLSIFRLYIDRLERSAADPLEIEALALKMRSEFEHVIRSVKSISRRLLPVKMEGETLAETLELLCQAMEQPGTGHIHFQNTGDPGSLDQQMEIYLLRIVQELIQNSFKHSSAWHIWVRMNWNPGQLTIEVEDDGSGFSKIPEFIRMLKKKNNTLKMRTLALNASIEYLHGAKGLLAKVSLPITKLQ
jgi:signal transduction histidine kinase